jgi:AraC-like DNA-binding protein
MDAHLANDLSLEEVVGIACLSSYHFSRMFKVSTGQSVHQSVLRRRMERSMALLAQRETSLAEVAAVGFCGQKPVHDHIPPVNRLAARRVATRTRHLAGGPDRLPGPLAGARRASAFKSRLTSRDSREFGPVSEDLLLGKVVVAFATGERAR